MTTSNISVKEVLVFVFESKAQSVLGYLYILIVVSLNAESFLFKRKGIIISKQIDSSFLIWNNFREKNHSSYKIF